VFCQTLRTVLAGLRSTGPVIVAGDFNQQVPRRKQPVRVRDALCGALEGLDVWSGENRSEVALIDHVACTPDLMMADLGWWQMLSPVHGSRTTPEFGLTPNFSPPDRAPSSTKAIRNRPPSPWPCNAADAPIWAVSDQRPDVILCWRYVHNLNRARGANRLESSK
jgi:hypothetical protein